MKSTICVIILIAYGFLAPPIKAETITASVAASMTDAFQEISKKYSLRNPGTRILPNFASSGSLAKQITQGAPVDIYISANERWIEYLMEKKLIRPENQQIFAHNSLVFVGKDSGKEVASMANLVQCNRIAIGSPESVPAGIYAKQAMQKSGIYEVLRRRKKLILAKDVRQALVYADRGEVDGAFVYRTDGLLARNARILFSVPDELYERVSYPVALTRAGAENKAARSLYEYMRSAEVALILTRYGFLPLSKAD